MNEYPGTLGSVCGPDVQPVGRRHRPHRRAVIGVPAGDDLVGARLVAALHLPLLGHLDRRFDRLGSTADEQHPR